MSRQQFHGSAGVKRGISLSQNHYEAIVSHPVENQFLAKQPQAIPDQKHSNGNEP
jgi:hypothetical protein